MTETAKTSNAVALRKESVDRNGHYEYITAAEPQVALRKESVDRNHGHKALFPAITGRSPQGERG